ncbi:MAG TPA: S24 family peptidase [Mycobacteriales bacterium]|nr:S24 family peptidase [Mycobacteriales bacterium]
MRSPLIQALVAGPSMVPTLRSGEVVLARRGGRVRPGHVVLARFRARPELLVVKRAVRAQDGGWWIESDNPYAHDDDSRRYGVADVLGRVIWRYWPPGRPSRRPPDRSGLDGLPGPGDPSG